MIITPVEDKAIRALGERMHVDNPRMVIVEALTTLDVLVTHQERGGTIILRNADGTEEPFKIDPPSPNSPIWDRK